jgi:hypothetical protein
MRQLDRYLSRLVAMALLLGLVGMPSAIRAHALGEDYIFINFRETSIDGHFEINFEDLEQKLGLEIPKGPQAAQQVATSAPRVHEYLRDNFSIGPEGGEPYVLEFTGTDVLKLPQGSYAKYLFRAETGPLPDRLDFRHDGFYEDDRFHRGLLLVETNAKTDEEYGPEYTAMVFGPSNSEQTLDLTAVPGLITPKGMIKQGVLHIWIGIDHILFLIALILPTVLYHENGTWKPVEDFHTALWNLLKIITVFTFAHSITLLLAALGLLSVPSRFVESMIALSIILVAWNNIADRVRGGALWVILFLGLFHGLGFASVMGHLPFRMGDLLKSVVAFNVGVELGQVAIVIALFPFLWMLRKRPAYVPLVLKTCSAVLILIAGYWFVQRAFGLA